MSVGGRKTRGARAEQKTLKALENSLLSGLAGIMDIETADPGEFSAKFMDLFERVKEECQESSLSAYRAITPKIIKQSRKKTKEFEKRNFMRWKPAFDHLEMMWSIAQELGEVHGIEIKIDGGEDDNVVMAALAHLFPRALLVTQEIICLLRGGFPDGALARWRSLHEISITSMYIAKNGESAAIAYLLSFHFAARRAALQMNEHSELANIRRFSDDELLEFDVRCAEAERLLGRKIDKDKFGEWPAITQTHANFAAIEKDVNMDHWRPYYKWASTHTHANHRPIDKLLGMSESADDVNLIGPSNSGFVDPFQLTSITLAQVTTNYLLLAPNTDRIVHSNIMLKLAEEMSYIAMETERTTREKFEGRKKNVPSEF